MPIEKSYAEFELVAGYSPLTPRQGKRLRSFYQEKHLLMMGDQMFARFTYDVWTKPTFIDFQHGWASNQENGLLGFYASLRHLAQANQLPHDAPLHRSAQEILAHPIRGPNYNLCIGKKAYSTLGRVISDVSDALKRHGYADPEQSFTMGEVISRSEKNRVLVDRVGMHPDDLIQSLLDAILESNTLDLEIESDPR